MGEFEEKGPKDKDERVRQLIKDIGEDSDRKAGPDELSVGEFQEMLKKGAIDKNIVVSSDYPEMIVPADVEE
jgi:hypothetical protein